MKDTSTGRIIGVHGGFKRLRSFQSARLVYDATVVFCQRFVPKGSRTVDQMVQAARSGVQNIAEGSAASGASKETEIKLTSVARASLTELQMDYEDFLRQRALPLWTKDSPSALAVRREQLRTGLLDIQRLMDQPPEVVANTLICLIHQTSYLLAHQLKALESHFAQSGGIRERMSRVRRLAQETCPQGHLPLPPKDL